MIKRSVTVDIKLTPEDLAREFLEMDHEEMARFFNAGAEIVDLEWSNSLRKQMAAVRLDGGLNDDGRVFAGDIGYFFAG